MNGWKTLTDTSVTHQTIQTIEEHCSELLIHAADVEGLCQGIDEELVERQSSSSPFLQRGAGAQADVIGLGEWVTIPCTYAGGAKGQSAVDGIVRAESVDISDLALVDWLSGGKVDLTFGS